MAGSQNEQRELSFAASDSEHGYIQWLAARQMTAHDLARKMNLPLGHEVEVWLYGGIRLRGKLRVSEELLFLDEEHVRHMELLIDKVKFTYREMESCVRLDC